MRADAAATGPRIKDRVRVPPKFAKVDPEDAPNLPAVIPGMLLGLDEDVVVEEWIREVRNPELAHMYRPKPYGDAIFWCEACKVFRRFARSTANMWGHAFMRFHMGSINGTSSDEDSPEKRLTYFMQLVAAAKLSLMDIQEQAIRDLLRLDRRPRRQLLPRMMFDAADMLLESHGLCNMAQSHGLCNEFLCSQSRQPRLRVISAESVGSKAHVEIV